MKRPIIRSEKESVIEKKKTKTLPGFLGGSVTNNPPANVGDMGLTPDSERSHTPWSNRAAATEPVLRGQEPQLFSPCA